MTIVGADSNTKSSFFKKKYLKRFCKFKKITYLCKTIQETEKKL